VRTIWFASIANRKGKRLSNEEWTSKTDPEAKVAKMKDGRNAPCYKPSTRSISIRRHLAAALHPATKVTQTTIEGTLSAAAKEPGTDQCRADPAKADELVADKGYHSRAVLKALERRGVEDPHRRAQASRVFTLARRRQSSRGSLCKPQPAWFDDRQAGRCGGRAEIVERSFAHNLDRGGMRGPGCADAKMSTSATWSTSPGHNLGILMRLLIGAGTPREAAARRLAYLLFVYTEEAWPSPLVRRLARRVRIMSSRHR